MQRAGRIKKIELTPVFIPFKEVVRQLMEGSEGGIGFALKVEQPWTGEEFVICQMYDEHGIMGVSEVFTWIPESGTSVESVIDCVKHGLSPYLIGQSPYEIQKIRTLMNNNVNLSEFAKGLLDMACYDLIGRAEEKPVYELLGGYDVERIDLAYLLPLASPEVVSSLCKMYLTEGAKAFRLKLGRGANEDLKIVESVRAAVGPDIRIRVDYNQAYSPNEAVRAIKEIEHFGIDYAEQPTPADDFAGMAYVQSRVDVPLMAHEGCFGIRDLITLCEMGAVRVIGLNSERPGGITNALRAIDYASCKGIDIVFHNQPTGIGSAQTLHTVAARFNDIKHPTELFGHMMLEHDLLKSPINYDNGYATLPNGPGWGVDLDIDAMNDYAKSATVVVE